MKTDTHAIDDQERDTPDKPESAGRFNDRRLALWAFAAYVAIVLPLVLLRLGSFHWFLGDDWFFLAGRDASLHDVLEPFNSQWDGLPLLVYRGLWSIFGLRTYVPYQASCLTLHLVAAALLRVVMRRAGVRPWIATTAAASFVLFGPGAANIIWGFPIGYVGALCFGLVQLNLSDHDGEIDRRDWLGLGAGLLGIMCSGVGTTMAFVVGIATLWRRGWRVAAFHTLPLALLYVTWVAVEHPDVSPFGRPPVGVIWEWVRSAAWSGFESIGHFTVVGVVLVAVLIVGCAISVHDNSVAELRQCAAPTAALLVGGPVFAITTAFGRWGTGTESATASRYVYMAAAFTLPAIAFAAEAMARRWRVTYLPLVILLLLPIPWNATVFERGPFNGAYFRVEQHVIVTAPRLWFATQVPRDVRLFSDPSMQDVTIGYLLDALHDGKLPPVGPPITAADANQFKVRLGVVQHREQHVATDCRSVNGHLDIESPKGTIIGIHSPVDVTTRDRNGHTTSGPVRFVPARGTALSIELDGLDLRLRPVPDESTIRICT